MSFYIFNFIQYFGIMDLGLFCMFLVGPTLGGAEVKFMLLFLFNAVKFALLGGKHVGNHKKKYIIGVN